MYVKNNVKYSLRNDLNLHLSNCEDIWIEIYSKSKSIILSTIYRHPISNITEFHKKLRDTLIILQNSKTNYIINGDVNINLLNPNNFKVKQYIDMLSSIRSCSLLTSPQSINQSIKLFILEKKEGTVEHINRKRNSRKGGNDTTTKR